MKIVLTLLATVVIFTLSSFRKTDKHTNLYLSLPDYCSTPDNLALAVDGTIILTCPNYADKQKGTVVKITKDREVINLGSIPGGRPKGVVSAPDGTIYICNAKDGGGGEILKIILKSDTIDSIEVIATGLVPNGIKYHNGYLYVTETKIERVKGESVTGGVYRFREDDRDIKVTGLLDDPNLIFTAVTTNLNHQFGLDGLTFDRDGKLYVGEFGDGTIYQLSLDDNGDLIDSEIYAQLPEDTGVDGMVMDDRYNLFIAGFCKNQLIKVDQNREISIIVQYPDNDGSNGELDQPVDLLFFEDLLLISNFDLMSNPGMVNRSHSKPYTISYIDSIEL